MKHYIIKSAITNKHIFLIIAIIIISNIITYNLACKYTNRILVDNIQTKIIVVEKQINKDNKVVDNNKNIVFNTKKGKITLNKSQYKEALTKYINTYAGNNVSSEYIDKLTNEYIRLTENFDDNNFMLYYIALCSVESNFNNKAKSYAGAIGIPQVMWNIWKDVAKNNWGVDKNQYVNDLYSQLYVGYKIYEVQYKKHKGNLIKAHNAYSGGHKGYHSRIVKRYTHLVDTLNTVREG